MSAALRAGGALLVLLFGAGCASEDFNSAPHPQPGEITVSAANYSETSASVIAAAVKAQPSVNPQLAPVKSLAAPQFYLFAPGEVDKSDVAFPAIARQLATALAAKGYIEASSAARTGHNPDRKVDLILRVHCGERFWRDPKVRTTDLTWDDGLVPKGSMHSLDPTGNSTVWDYRAGGNDASLVQIEEAIGQASSRGKGDVGPNDPSNPMSGLSTELTVLPSRDFFLVMVEAFDFKTLRRKHGLTPVLWTTFVALPKSGNQTFSQVLPALLRAAGPYFGTTSQGLAVFNDDRAKVESGAPYVVP